MPDRLAGPTSQRARHVLLSRNGGDRATGYTMSAKVVRANGLLLCTWIDGARQNQCALVDPASEAIISSGPLGIPGVDNHCGAALAVASSGRVHAVTGGHHSSLQHYTLEGMVESLQWRHASSIDERATYPSLICDAEDTLHLAYRCLGDPWTLNYRRCEQGRWSEPRRLVLAEKEGYVYWTNALALGPGGRVHLAFSNTRALRDGSFYYGASHLYSDDSGESWRQLGRGCIPHEGAPIGDLAFIEGDVDPGRIEPVAHRAAHAAPGPHNAEYLQINLSNPVVDDSGNPSVILHNGMDGAATLYRCHGDQWSPRALDEIVQRILPGWTIHMQSSLSRRADGTFEIVLMVQPEMGGWGSTETELVRVTIDSSDGPATVDLVRSPDSSFAHWLPALEHWSWSARSTEPAMLFTRGRNAGGFHNNRNDLRTKVWLDLPPQL